ncbi:hypothetical protein LCGC14_1976040, partial [marine sediment metagenome]
PLNKKEAEKAIRRAIPNFDEYLENNQIEIILSIFLSNNRLILGVQKFIKYVMYEERDQF